MFTYMIGIGLVNAFLNIGENAHVMWLWLILLPPIVLFLAGLVWGGAVALLGEISILIIIFSPLIEYVHGGLDKVALQKFPLVYTMSFLISLFLQYDICKFRLQNEDTKTEAKQMILAEKKKMDEVTIQSILAIANTVDAKDACTKQHSARVAEVSVLIARKLNWEKADIVNLYNLALLHDIGKISVPDSLLNKPYALSKEEFEIMKQHVLAGAEILKDITMIEHVDQGAKYHHERFDGTGYCSGLKGTDIPFVARIIAVADAYDAMTSDRTYRPKRTIEQVIEEFKKGKGTQFDPQLADIMLEIIDEMQIKGESLEDIDDSEDRYIESAVLKKTVEGFAESAISFVRRDPLTGLLNREDMRAKINEYLIHQKNAGALLIMDIDNFKMVNDLCGHVVGDEILIQFARLLEKLSTHEKIVCRLGGDEFIVFLPGETDIETIRLCAQEIITKARGTINSPQLVGLISISIGISVTPENGVEFDELYAKADKALYFVKKNGKDDYYFFNDEKPQFSDKKNKVDIDMLVTMIEEAYDKNEAYVVEYEGFRKVYNFLNRNIDRTKQQIQIALFTIVDEKGNNPDTEMLIKLLGVLQHVIALSLRVGDLTTNFSTSQIAVLLVGSNLENGEKVAERITTTFYKTIPYHNICLQYTVRDMCREEEKE